MVPLKITTDCSLLKSLIKISELISFLSAHNISACALCDEDLFGVMEFYTKCLEKGLKPIIGLEISINDQKVYIYAKDYEGYKYLLKLNTRKFTKDLELSDLNNSHLKIILPYKSISLYSSIPFKDNLYLGYQSEMEKKNNLILSKKIVYLNEARCLLKEDVPYLKYLQDLGGNFSFDESSYLNLNISSFDAQTTEEFTKDINLVIPFNERYIPKYNEKIDPYNYLKSLVIAGLNKRFNHKVSEKYIKRAMEELDVIKDMGFLDYFLIVYDYVLFAKKAGIAVGPGRGSAAGSLVSYAIGITDIDPLKYDLLFARFLNPYRKKMPDIDIDFEDSRRGEVIAYVKEKYGQDKVALGLTFTNYKSKLILRDLAKVLKVDNNLFEKFIKNISSALNLAKNRENENVRKYLDLYPELKELYDIALHLEGLKKNISTHAAGVVISSVALDEIIPIYIENDVIKTGIPMEYLENLGLLKMDFLGLRNLSVIANVARHIPGLKLSEIPLDDARAFALLQSGDTEDIFQFESRYASMALHKLQVKDFNELAIAVALVRPGPNKQIDQYITNKNAGNYHIHQDLEDILKSTYGIIIFQEQVMMILSKIAGYTGYEADNIRGAMSKKKMDIILKEKDIFIKRALENGYEQSFVEDLFAKILKFAEYSFNKSHSVGYAIIVYEIAYLKANYPVIYSAVMLGEVKNIDKKKYYLNIIRKNNMHILKPSVDVPSLEFKIKNKYLLLPLNMISGLPENIIHNLINERLKGPYQDIFAFVIRTKDYLNHNIYETLVMSGALDTFKITRRSLIESEEVLFNYAEIGDSELKPVLNNLPEYDEVTLRDCEIKYYGMYISNHPCAKYQNVVKVSKAKDYLFRNINMALLVERINKITTKKGEEMAFVTASDETGKIEIILFPRVQKGCPDLKVNDIILINGKSSKRFADYQILVNKLTRNRVVK